MQECGFIHDTRRRWAVDCSMAEGCLCVVGFLSLQALFNWMDQAPLDDLLVAAAMLLLLFAAWVAYQITGRE